jgi:hypothetical protein
MLDSGYSITGMITIIIRLSRNALIAAGSRSHIFIIDLWDPDLAGEKSIGETNVQS